MTTLKFKTNINCSSCIAKVTPYLNVEESIEKWDVNTQTPDKVLTVSGQNITQETVEAILEKAGYIIKEKIL